MPSFKIHIISIKNMWQEYTKSMCIFPFINSREIRHWMDPVICKTLQIGDFLISSQKPFLLRILWMFSTEVSAGGGLCNTAASPSCRVASVLSHTLQTHGHCLLGLLGPHSTRRDPGALCYPPWGILLASEIKQNNFPYFSLCCPQFGYFSAYPLWCLYSWMTRSGLHHSHLSPRLSLLRLDHLIIACGVLAFLGILWPPCSLETIP